MAALIAEDDYRSVRPRAPARPLLCAASRKSPLATPVAAITDLPNVAWFSNGRSAIAHAAMLAKVGPDSTVLMPAYHCESMIAPIAWLGARIKLYRIRENLEIDLEHLESIADSKTRLVLYPQYFGHRRPGHTLCQLSKARGWSIVEDCAHAFFTLDEADNLGVDSDFMIASSSKFLAAFDGGVLASRKTYPGWPRTRRPRLMDEFQAIIDALEYAFEYGRLPVIRGIVAPILTALRSIRGTNVASPEVGALPASRFGGAQFEAKHVNLGATMLARWLATHADRKAIAAARRENWEALRNRLGQSPRLSFPVDALGPHDVPYVLAVELADPDRAFPELKRRGVPVYRWESVFGGDDGVDCAVSSRFRRSLIQLPCHQGLTESERDWIADTILAVT